jgi:hypothetical protein
MFKLAIHLYQEADRYWVAAFPIQPKDKTMEIVWWCTNTFGPGLGPYRVENSPFKHRWINDAEWGELRFYDGDDAAMFVLFWNE